VPVFDLHETPDGRPFFTLALLEGKPLESLISDYKLRSLSLSEEDIRSILDQVAEALHYLHQNRLVFCDLKPANIMVSEHAGMLSCTLIDFGIAQRLQTSETASTTRGNITGTSHYLSPEQVQGRHPDVRSDVYAFGVLGYELVTGAPPFTQRELFDATAAHLLAKIPALTTSHPSLSRALATMIELCLAKDPEDRFQSMLEIRERLARRPRLSFLQMIRAQWQRIITIPSRVQKRRSGRDSDDKPQIGESSTPS
jgi:serine/threonine-protein kinase